MKKWTKKATELVPVPGVGVRMPDVTEQLGNVSLLDFLSTVPAGHGGAICVAAHVLELFNVAEIVFRNLYVAKNEAKVGGKAFISHWPTIHRLWIFQEGCRSTSLSSIGTEERALLAFQQLSAWILVRDCYSSMSLSPKTKLSMREAYSRLSRMAFLSPAAQEARLASPT